MGIKEAYETIKKNQQDMNELKVSEFGCKIRPKIDISERNKVYDECLKIIEEECPEVEEYKIDEEIDENIKKAYGILMLTEDTLRGILFMFPFGSDEMKLIEIRMKRIRQEIAELNERYPNIITKLTIMEVYE